MSLNAAAVRLLAEKGLSASDIADVMEAMEAKPRPLTGAERAQRHRDKTRNENNVTSVTPEAPSPNEYISNPLRDDPSEANASSVATADDCRAIVDCWNEMARPHGLSTVTKLTDKRRKALRSRLKADGFEAIKQAIEHVPKSPFLLGQTGNWAGRGADFEFLIKPDTITKILEGKYDGRLQPSVSGLQRPDPLRAALADAIAEEAAERDRTGGGQADHFGAFSSFPAH